MRVALAVSNRQRVQRKPSACAIAAAVYESSPPLSSTTAALLICDCDLRLVDMSDKSPITNANTNPEPLDAPRRGIPDVLVQLQLHADRQAVGEHPLGQRPRVHDAVHRRQVNGRRATRARSWRAIDVARVLVVARDP